MDSIKITAEDKAFYQGINTLSNYGASLQNTKRSLRNVQKDINHPNNLEALKQAQRHIERTIKTLETWKELTSE